MLYQTGLSSSYMSSLFHYIVWNGRLFHYINERALVLLGLIFPVDESFQSFCLVFVCKNFLVCFSSSSLCMYTYVHTVHCVITSKINSYIYLNKFSIFCKCLFEISTMSLQNNEKKNCSNFYISDKGNEYRNINLFGLYIFFQP